MAVNALDNLTIEQRSAVLNYTLISDISDALNTAVTQAIAQGEPLYVPAGLWLIQANDSSRTGWHINIPDHQSLTIYGDGDATIIRRKATETLAHTSPMVWIAANDGIDLTFQDLLFDGNEANCPTDEGFTFLGDGSTREFSYSFPDAEAEKGFSVTFVKDGVESIQSRGGFAREGDYPNRLLKFTVAPPAGTTVRFYRIFAHEQSANVKFSRGSGIPNTLSFDNITMTGCVGDGFHANAAIQRLQVTNWRSYGRTRRPRADIQLSRIPLQVTSVTNFTGDAFESEPSEVNAEHVINLANMLVRGAFDIAGDKSTHADGSAPNFANVHATGVIHFGQFGIGLPFSNFARVRGHFVNCNFVDTNRIQRCQVTFKDGKFKVLGRRDKPDTADHILIMHDKPEAFVEFENVCFESDATLTGGHYLACSGTSDPNRRTRLINCRNVQPLDYFAVANRGGTMIFEGGRLRGKSAAIWIANGGGVDDEGLPYLTNAILRNPGEWSPSVVEISSYVAAPTQIEMDGTFNAEAVKPIANTQELTRGITWVGSFTGTVLSDPNGRIRGFPGLLLRVVGANQEWRYRYADKFAAMEYDLIP